MPAFLDEATIYVKAGDGGAGAKHFRREKYVPLGGPDGGDGGRGGSICLRASRALNTLYPFQRKRRFTAEPGQPGGPARMHGRNGEDLTIEVPVGTLVRSQETGELLADLTADGQTLVIAKGGKGGLGNVHFKSSTNQAPNFAEKGEPGHEQWLELELRLIADVGIIGLPNAGKSTLLSVMSAARPKIADYPFTTLTPNLGVVEVDDEYTFVAADIPGLIEGAHEGAGLGHEFLRHIERTVVLVHVLDGSSPDPKGDFSQVNDELTLYDIGLGEKPQLVAINKLDVIDARDRFPQLEGELRALGFEVFGISAATGEGVPALIYRLAGLVREEVRKVHEVVAAEVPVIRPAPDPEYFQIERKRKTFHVRGENVERLAVMTDLESDEALNRLQRRLKRMGVFSALQKAGIREGGRVMIGPVELTWTSEGETESRRPPAKRS